ncbi:cell wall hydrolase [Paenibacillus sp. M1]|uniref:Cell wall hydrolase n=1 Tax=Paenibacillus haidiansis TaxID=1574488 RepID=A0ABU7VV61_9BACL
MYIFRQNRYVALLIGAILVCIGAICLLKPNSGASGREDRELYPVSGYMQANRDLSASVGPSNRSEPATMPAGENRNKAFNKALLPNLITLEMKRQSAETAVQSSPKAQTLVSERIWLRKQALEKPEPAVAEVVPDPLTPPKQLFFTRTELLSHADKDKAVWSYVLDDEELLLLQKIVMAEAEGEPYEGKVAVANVVLNRLRSANYPDTIKEVIYQKSQFSPVRNGRLNKVKPDEDTIHAVNEALNGRKEVADDTYYFLSLKLAKDLTIAKTKDKAKVIGNHTFYK